MFCLHNINDTVRIPCSYFLQGKTQTLTKLIDDKYSNKIVRGVGMGICLYDFINIGDSYVYPGDGAAQAEVEFSLIVYKPFPGQIIEGVVSHITRDFVRVSVGFFNDIYIPSVSLPQPSEFSAATNETPALWTWKYFESEREGLNDTVNLAESGDKDVQNKDEDVNDGEEGYYIETGHAIRVQVKSVSFGSSTSSVCLEVDTPSSDLFPPTGEISEDIARSRSSSMVFQSLKNQRPMIVLAQCQEAATGMIEWWDDLDHTDEISQADDAQSM